MKHRLVNQTNSTMPFVKPLRQWSVSASAVLCVIDISPSPSTIIIANDGISLVIPSLRKFPPLPLSRIGELVRPCGSKLCRNLKQQSWQQQWKSAAGAVQPAPTSPLLLLKLSPKTNLSKAAGCHRIKVISNRFIDRKKRARGSQPPPSVSFPFVKIKQRMNERVKWESRGYFFPIHPKAQSAHLWPQPDTHLITLCCSFHFPLNPIMLLQLLPLILNAALLGEWHFFVRLA